MVSDEKGLPESFVPGKKRPDGSGIDLATTENVKWVARLGSQTYGNAHGRRRPGVRRHQRRDDGRSRSTSPPGGGVVKCFDEATGKLLWQLAIPRLETKDPNFNFDNMDLGICSSPTVDGDRVYLVTNRCEVLCLDVHGMANGNDGPFLDEGQYMVGRASRRSARPTDGDIIWRYDMIDELNVWPHDAANCSVLVHGDLRLRLHVQRRGPVARPRALAAGAEPDRAGQAHRPAGGPGRREDRHAAVPRPMVVALAGPGGRPGR